MRLVRKTIFCSTSSANLGRLQKIPHVHRQKGNRGGLVKYLLTKGISNYEDKNKRTYQNLSIFCFAIVVSFINIFHFYVTS